MARISHNTANINASDLLKYTEGVLRAQEVPPTDAKYVSWHLVETNLRGTDSHGVARVPHYVRRLKNGSINPRPKMTFERRSASLGLVDGDYGLGHLVMAKATEHAAELAEASGAGWVAVRNSSHCGALAPFGLNLAERSMLGIVFTHVDPMVLPHGASEPFCGTNPITMTAPGVNGRAFCLDMATSVVPWNLVANAANEQIAIPQGWGVDKNGADTTDPNAVSGLYPFGQYKGSGLGIMIDVFCSMLGGAPYGPDIPSMYGDLTARRQLGGLVGAIAIRPYEDPEEVRRRVTEMGRRLGGLRKAKGVDRVRFPGEPELEMKERRQRDGIPIGLRTLAELNGLADEFGLSRLVANAEVASTS